eukprot:22633-Chlamydomonas_euryale.AAC.2
MALRAPLASPRSRYALRAAATAGRSPGRPSITMRAAASYRPRSSAAPTACVGVPPVPKRCSPK